MAPALVIAVAALVSACASSGAVPRPFPGASLPPAPVSPPAPSEAPLPEPTAPERAGAPAPVPASPSGVLQTALALQGTPYRNGGSDPSGFDCSGFVQWTFDQHGVHLPREVRDQVQVGQRVDLERIEPGDLLFFETVSRGASHVGIALGNGRFIHAPSSRGVVRIESYGVSYWASRFVTARRLDSGMATTD